MLENLPIHIYLGGSFDPVHNSHVAMLTHVYRTLSATSNIQPPDQWQSIQASFLPTSRSPLKTASTDPQHRLNMLRLVCDALQAQAKPEANPSVATLETQYHVSEHEIWQTPPTYTIDTLTKLRKECPHASIIFVLGADSIASLDRWKKGAQLTQYAHLWVIPRDNPQSNSDIVESLPIHLQLQVTTDHDSLKTSTHGRIYIDSHSVAPISSSMIRAAIAYNDFKTAKSTLPAEVYSYIMQNNLYRSE